MNIYDMWSLEMFLQISCIPDLLQNFLVNRFNLSTGVYSSYLPHRKIYLFRRARQHSL